MIRRIFISTSNFTKFSTKHASIESSQIFKHICQPCLKEVCNFKSLTTKSFHNANFTDFLDLKCKRNGHIFQNWFHTSSRQRMPLPPVLVLLIKPLAKIGAAVTGRSVRLWFRRLSPEQKSRITSNIKHRWYIFAGCGAALVGGSILFYVSHLEETPVTGRQRFIIFTQEQINKISDSEAKMIEEVYQEKYYTKTDAPYLRVLDVAKRLVEANPELQPFDKWTINVVKDPLVNAFVLPNGHMFVFDGILQLANTQDQLAIILGHEMAHNVLGHGIEDLSYGRILDVFIISCIAALWFVIPIDSIAVISHWLSGKVIQITTKLPHSRQMEKEADKVGLKFASRACYDVREGSVLWQKMDYNQKLLENNFEGKLPEWIQTHPDSLKRARHLDFLLPQAEEWRKEMKCPALPDKDPRDCFKIISQDIENALLASKTGQNLNKVPQKSSIFHK
ncbi:metalloendopeptidase OMA1 mitochondrial [Biomphalaria pfeifferi]|uniref:Metalloendopeptidase OMA1, mitochondrial n=1 Tax=Biomphalaria pfeifferi TaxID=112525 RepID=A0AAD8BYK6_BIOPF|nr:metalloendopeptidase OMA1 mitochondrial [Biomphalaria pfeifferi]